MSPVCALTRVIWGLSPGLESVRAGASAGGGAAGGCGAFAREDVISVLREVAAFALTDAPPTPAEGAVGEAGQDRRWILASARGLGRVKEQWNRARLLRDRRAVRHREALRWRKFR